jgi:hypothetical protein
VLLSNFGSLSNGSRYVSTLGDTDTNLTLVVTNDNQGAETETATTLNDASHAVDVDNAFVKFFLFFDHWAATIATWWTTTALWGGVLSLCVNFSHD